MLTRIGWFGSLAVALTLGALPATFLSAPPADHATVAAAHGTTYHVPAPTSLATLAHGVVHSVVGAFAANVPLAPAPSTTISLLSFQTRIDAIKSGRDSAHSTAIPPPA